MISNNFRSMCFGLLFCLTGAASAQTAPTQTVAPASIPAAVTPAPEAAPVVETTESYVLPESPKNEKSFRSWLHSTTIYQRMYVRITLHSTPERRAN